MSHQTQRPVSRAVLYTAMGALLSGIFIGAFKGAPPVFLAVGFIGEIILGATAHLSTMIERHGIPHADAQART